MTGSESTIGGLWVRDHPGDSGGPLVVGLHGRAAWPERIEPHRPNIPGARHVLPRGIFTFEEGYAWYRTRPARVDELTTSVEALQGLLGALWAEGHSPERTLLWGFSQGAMVALQLALTLPESLAGTAAISPRLHPSASEQPEMMARAREQRFLLIHGDVDAVIPPESGLEARKSLEEAGAACTWILYPGAHVITPTVVQALQTFASNVLAS